MSAQHSCISERKNNMSSAIFFALLSLAGAGIHDVVFKRYASKERSRGTYIFAIGVVWAILQVSLAVGQGETFTFTRVTLGYGMAAGLFVTISNLLLLESLTHIDASLGSTLYRLNTVGVVILSVLILHEPLGLIKGLGVAVGLLAVLLLYQRDPRSAADNNRFMLYFALAVMAAFFRAGYGVTSKAGLLEGANLQLLLILGALNWVVGGVTYALLREKRFRLTRKKCAYALLSGCLVFLIVNALMRAIELGQASVVIPIANMSFIMALMLSVALGMERFTRRKLFAVATAICSIVLLSLV